MDTLVQDLHNLVIEQLTYYEKIFIQSLIPNYEEYNILDDIKQIFDNNGVDSEMFEILVDALKTYECILTGNTMRTLLDKYYRNDRYNADMRHMELDLLVFGDVGIPNMPYHDKSNQIYAYSTQMTFTGGIIDLCRLYDSGCTVRVIRISPEYTIDQFVEECMLDVNKFYVQGTTLKVVNFEPNLNRMLYINERVKNKDYFIYQLDLLKSHNNRVLEHLVRKCYDCFKVYRNLKNTFAEFCQRINKECLPLPDSATQGGYEFFEDHCKTMCWYHKHVHNMMIDVWINPDIDLDKEERELIRSIQEKADARNNIIRYSKNPQ